MPRAASRLALIAAIAAALLASGCGGRKSHKAKVTPDTTPPTKEVLKNLPNGLLPDSANAEHSN